MKRLYLLLLFSIFVHGLWAQALSLKRRDIRPLMEELFNYHVEHRELSPLIVRRASKIFIEQFDPGKVYLLQEEIRDFFNLSEEDIQKVIKRYSSDDFPLFSHLNKIMQKAIVRCRRWREEVKREFILNTRNFQMMAQSGESYLAYAESEGELKQRIKRYLFQLLLEEKEFHHLEAWTPEDRARIFQLWEKRLQQREDSYLHTAQAEHFFTLHLLKAFAKSLDAHSAFFTSEEAAQMRAGLEKQFEGVGVVLREGIEGIVIVDLIKDGPAQKSGLIAVGDLLVEVDGVSILDLSYEEVLERMKGNGKNDLSLGFHRKEKNGQKKNIKVELKREKIVMQNQRLQFDVEPHGNGCIGKLILPAFYEGGQLFSAEKDIREAIKALKSRGPLKGLVLDLRENAGGFLSQAVKVAGLFITSGVIVISKYAKDEIKYLRDMDGRLYFDGPLVILTSKASASAAEIVAQALQDYGAAIIVGDERTYGKGTIQYQTVTDENAKAFFKVTVGRYYTVSGKSTQIEGVKADIQVPTHWAPHNVGERFLEYPLASDRIPAAFVDPLTDINPQDRHWFQTHYLPYLQKPRSEWQKMLPLLSKNSQWRLSHDKNFVLFLQQLARKEKSVKMKPWGEEDLQMAEAVHILKEMLILKER